MAEHLVLGQLCLCLRLQGCRVLGFRQGTFKGSSTTKPIKWTMSIQYRQKVLRASSRGQLELGIQKRRLANLGNAPILAVRFLATTLVLFSMTTGEHISYTHTPTLKKQSVMWQPRPCLHSGARPPPRSTGRRPDRRCMLYGASF